MTHDLALTPLQLRELCKWAITDSWAADVLLRSDDGIMTAQQGDATQSFDRRGRQVPSP
ncbi:MAG: hypothetical protein ACXVHB_06050 [Solirubrobacteraceae bacterium]